MKIINNTIFMYFYLKGVMKFNAKNFKSAQQLFQKAMRYIEPHENELFCQYYGQTILSLNHVDESFIFLSKAYEIYEKNGWKISSEEEYNLVKNTLDALKHLDDNFNLKIKDIEYNKDIKWKKK